MSIILIAEKPDAAHRIAISLSNTDPKEIKKNGVKYYVFEKNKQEHVVVAAVGHLFNLKQIKRGNYPVFDVHWIPSYKARKSCEFTKKYLDTIKKVINDYKFSEFIIATDYDREGSVIGFNILKFICLNEKNDLYASDKICLKCKAKRMKFSTLTKQDLTKAYNETSNLDFGLINAGITRNILDFYYGINSSKALTSSLKTQNSFTLLTAGRVQSPILYLLNEREKEIKKFKSIKFWQIELHAEFNGIRIIASHKNKKFWKKEEAEEIVKNCYNKKAIVSNLNVKKYKQDPPIPFNVTSLQIECYKLFGYSPSVTSIIAQNLYSRAMISYPRTSSQKLPPQIGYKKIMESISKLKEYELLIQKLLKKTNLIPRQGKLEDTAHEAIHPTIEPPKRKLIGNKWKVYDIICKRFLSVFADPAIKESINVTIDIDGNEFVTRGERTLENNWIDFYQPYIKSNDVILPDIKNGDELEIKNIKILEKETSPPSRFSQSSIINEMEKRDLGTRSTRAQILQTLYDRKYIIGRNIEVTNLGMQISETLKKYVPELVDEKLTKKIEDQMNNIESGKEKPEKIVKDIEKILIDVFSNFKEKEMDIGKDLSKALIETIKESKILGKCPNCKNGKLKTITSMKTGKSFVGCTSYQEENCHTAFPLPQNATITPLNKTCNTCGYPIISIRTKYNKIFRMCINNKCETKENWKNRKKPL